MTFSRLRRALTLTVVTALAVGTTAAIAPPAAAAGDYCSGPGRYLLLTDPTGAANEALCRIQEATLQQLSEQQWGEEYTADQRSRMLRWGRSDALGALYVELLRIASTDAAERTTDEATVYGWLQTTLAALRHRMAEAAYAEQIAFASDPCGYTPPTPGGSAIQCGNSDSLITLFGPPPGPTYEQFVSYGAQRALAEDFGPDQLALIGATARSARTQLIGAALGAVGGIGIGIGLVAAATAGMAYTAMLGPIAVSTAAATAAVSALGTFVVAAAASVFFVAIAITTAVVRGIQVVEEAQIPDQLRDDIATSQQPVDIASWVGDDSSRALLLLQAIARRINPSAPPAAPVPSAPTSIDPGFLVSSGVDDTTFGQSLRFRSPLSQDAFFTAWLDHGWWVIVDEDGTRAMTHALVYVDHEGRTRSASWMERIGGDGGSGGFLVTTLGTSDAGADGSGTDCTPQNGCETTTSLHLLTPPTDTSLPALRSTATLATQPMTFTHLPTLDSSYRVGDSISASISASTDYLTTMSYHWEVIRQDGAGNPTARIDDDDLHWTFTIPGSYRLVATAVAASGETIAHDWTMTVTGDGTGQLIDGIQLTQYPSDGATPGVSTPGPWREGETSGTICLSTGATDATNYTLQFAGDDVESADDVTAGYACFPRPASAVHAGVAHLAAVGACLASAAICSPTTGLTYVEGQWVQGSPFTYTVSNEPPTVGINTIGDMLVGRAGESLTLSDATAPDHFTVGDEVSASTVVTDAGGEPLTVHIRWSDGTGETRVGVPSGSTITVTHPYSSVAWGPVGVQIWAVDDANATGNIATGWFVVQPRPATVTLETAVGSGGLVTVTGTISDPDGTASILGISWGDGSGDGQGDGSGYRYDAPFPAAPGTEARPTDADGTFQLTHHYATGGTHDVQVYVWNGASDFATASATVTLPNTPPAVESKGPITTGADREVSVDALIGDLNAGDLLTVRADFDDGGSVSESGHSPGDTVTIAHHFAADGPHTVTVTVTDGATGSSSQTTRCFVLSDGRVDPCADSIPSSGDDVRDRDGQLTASPATAQRGGQVSISLGTGHAHETATVYVYSTPILLGALTADASGIISVQLPADIAPGSHTVAAFVGGVLVGWAPITVEAAGSDAGSGDGGSRGDGGTNGDSSSNDDGSSNGDSSSDSAAGSDSSGAGSDSSGADADTGSDASTVQPDTSASTDDAETASSVTAATSSGNEPTSSATSALANTGLATGILLVLGLTLVTLGAALVLASRRHRSGTSRPTVVGGLL